MLNIWKDIAQLFTYWYPLYYDQKLHDCKDSKDPNAFGKKKEDKQVKNATEPEEPPEETESTEPKEESGWLSKMGTDKADKRNES